VEHVFRNILVAYDGSPTSRSALAQAYQLAQAEEADVTVVTVAPTVAPLAMLAPYSVEGLRAELDRWARTKLEEAKASAPDSLTVRTIERNGHVGDEIVAEIESGDYDLVVLGSRGHGRVTTEILGSVNNHVHYHSNVPTLTIDTAEPARADSKPEEATAGVG
jgi:nucleotide-binding universal stress UspA family protein